MLDGGGDTTVGAYSYASVGNTWLQVSAGGATSPAAGTVHQNIQRTEIPNLSTNFQDEE